MSGTSPFGAALSGEATFASTDSTLPATKAGAGAYIYFPAGRVAGAPVQLSIQSGVIRGQYFFGPQVALADDLSATGLTVCGHDTSITADLLPGLGGLLATVSMNFSSPGSDVANILTASMLMCPAGQVPAPAMQITPLGVFPIATLSLNSTTPIATSTLETLRITSPSGPVPVTVSTDPKATFRGTTGPNYVITAKSAFPPGQQLSFDASEVRDVLGRTVPLTFGQYVTASPSVAGTSGVIEDSTFATPPTSGGVTCSGPPGCNGWSLPVQDAGAPQPVAVCTSGCSLADGILTISPYANVSQNLDVLLALPVSTATKLRVRVAVGDPGSGVAWCISDNRSAFMDWAALAVVGPNGELSSRVTLSCDGVMADHVIALPNASPLWLAVHVEGVPRVPYHLPPGLPPKVRIDELELF